MIKNQAMKIFEKYNPIDRVVRCPNGRAKMRKPLDLYAKAAVNLYGIIRQEEFVEIFNAQNKEQTTAEEVFTILLPNVQKSKWYGFYKDYIVHYAILSDFDWVDGLEKQQVGKPRYIPPKEIFLQYEWEDHEDSDHWQNVRTYMLKTFGHNNGITMDGFDEIKIYLKFGIDINDLGRIMEKYNLIPDSQKQANEFLDLLMLAANNTRIWENKGYTPDEMTKFKTNTMPQEPVINQPKQIRPNEKCLCGSGMKYKKCCALIESNNTAHLSYSECELFYNTWYKLLKD